ncbi:MAG TPA: intradiol ring-cleavage dioxygenase, partial [Thermomicrobiales bacterium]|nr:intradiol ring-cleavage dioxygenase [Thermomicrobiales bacterium]
DRDWPSDYDLDNARIHARATRRHVLKIGAAAGVTAFGIGAVARGAVAQATATSATPDATAVAATPATSMCVLTPELTEGPYYLDDLLVRNDITEGKAGIPLDLKITVLDSSTCTPLANAAVDVWHCDANGFYSGYTDKNPGGGDAYVDDGSDPDTFLRGVMLTDDNGLAEFQTIYPGWYTGRDIHIHMKVHVGGATEDGTYDGGTVAHTGQLAFEDSLTDEVAKIEPYASRTTTFLRFEDDGVFGGVEDGDTSYFLTMPPKNADSLADGFTGTINVGVDPTANHTEDAGMGGGGGNPGGDPGSGNPPGGNPPDGNGN